MTDAIPTPGRTELRRFGVTSGAIVAVLFGLLLPWLFDRAWPLWPWLVAGALLVAGLLIPTALGPVYRGWMKFGHVIGAINTRIILALTFYLMIFPIGVLMRLLRNDPMARRLDKQIASYRVLRQDTPRSMEKPF